MRFAKKLTSILALALTLSMMLSACQVPEGVEVPSGVSVPSDLSDLTSEELAQLESILEEEDISLDVDALEEEAVSEEEEAQSDDATGTEGVTDADSATGAEDVAGAEGTVSADADAQTDGTVKGTVELASGRDWVHKILNVQEYVNAYPDLQAAYGDNWDGYVDHYLTHGLYEGRDEGKLFDPWAYAEAYPDVKAAYGDDANAIIQHYVNHGYYEGKTAGTAAGYVDMADKTSREYMMSHKVVEREPGTRLEALVGHAETVLKYARNIEGADQPRLFADGLNQDTYEPTRWNRGLVENEPVSSDIYSQFNLLKMLDGLSVMTGDPKYSEAALEQITTRFNTPGLVDKNGLFYEGGHSFLNIMTGEHYGLGYHETKDNQLPLELMYKADPEGTKRYITAFWNAHILDWSNLLMNRHGYYDLDMTDAWDSVYTDPDPWVSGKDVSPFMSTGNDLMDMAWFMTEVTGDPKYAAWGELMLDKYIAVSNPETGLVGEQYGIMTDDSIYGVDRFLDSAMGADFVTRTGFDFKTATYDDYKLFGANSLITRTSLKCNTAYGPMKFVNVYKKTGNEKVYNFVVSNMLSWEEYVYDQELHRYNTPILNDGTDLNEGKDGKQLIATKTGYYMTQGKPFAEYEGIWGGVFPALIETISMLKPEDTEAYDRLWTAARSYARNVGLGDIGTRMGENIQMTAKTGQCSVQYVQAVALMYKYSGAQEYLDAVCTMADRLVKGCYDPELGMFNDYPSAPYAQIGPDSMWAVYIAEAASRGMLDQIDIEISQGVHDIPHIGKGQVMSTNLWFTAGKVAVKSVKFDRENYTVVVHEEPQANFSDLNGAEEISAIKQMASIGVMDAEADGLFHPEKGVTRAEMVDMIKALFGFTDDAVIAEVFADVDLDASYAHYEVTRAEMASIIAKALAVKLPNKTWNTGDATYRLTDKDSIPAWAKDYADIVTNYRLMVDLEEETFEPSAVVTKDMAAGIFQEVARYIEVPEVKAVLPEVLPLNPDNDTMIWESMDTSIVEVDSQGRLYPVGTGTTKVRVTVDEKFADLEVTVAIQDNWMVKEVLINGEVFTDFNANELEYYINLDKGVYTVPTITATSFSGEEVVVEYPDSLPGVVTFYVKGFDIKYSLQVDNDFIDYIVDENFNHKTGTPIANITTDRFTWFINGLTVSYIDSWKVIPKNWVRPDYEGYGCMVFPYKHVKNVQGDCYLTLSEKDMQLVGEQADDMLMVFEMDLAVKNIEGKKKGFNLWFMEQFGTYYHAAARFIINEDGIARETNSTSVDKPTKRQLTDSEFVNFRIVIDKKNRTFDYFFNGDLLQKDISFFHGENVPNIYAMYIGIPVEEEDSKAELFMDNLKVYQLTHAAYEEMMPQEELPPPTPKPEWLTNPIDINYDNFRVGTTIQDTSKDPYTGHIGEGMYYGYATVVEKTKIDSTANATDHCMEIKYMSNFDWDGSFRYMLDEAVWQKLGEGADDNNLVVEMDVAIGGADDKPKGYSISLSEPLSAGYHSVARIKLAENAIGRMVDSSDRMVDPTLRTATEKGVFNNIKIVINKKTKSFSYYVDGVMIEKDVPAMYNNPEHIGMIWIAVYKEGVGEYDSKLYIDNVKMYVEEKGEVPTPRPTHVPVPTQTPAPTATPHPYPIDENYDSYALGTNFGTKVSKEYYNVHVPETAYLVNSNVVARTVVDANAAPDDYCFEFTYNTAYDTNFSIDLLAQYGYALGDKAFGSRYVVTEMDIALKGDDLKTKPYEIWFSERLATGYRSVARFKLMNNRFGRIVTGSTGALVSADKQPYYEKGTFANLKVVVDKQTRKVSYFWNGVLIESDVNALYSDTPNFGRIVFVATKEGNLDSDLKLYVDNVKMYEAEEMPSAPTMAPATPAPTMDPNLPTPTPAPTESPIIIEEDFNRLSDIWGATGPNYSLEWGLSIHWDRMTLATKDDGQDKWMKLSPIKSNESGVYALPVYMRITRDKQYELGSSADVTTHPYLVAEMDVMLDGADAQKGQLVIRMGGEGYFAITNFALKGDRLARNIDSSTLTGLIEDGKNAYTPGTVGHLKYVLNRSTKQYSYFWNGELIEKNVNAQFGGATETPALKYIYFEATPITLDAGQTDADVQIYVDNVMLYGSTEDQLPEEEPVPTVGPVPTPTAAPTQAPATPAPTEAPTEAPATPTAEPTAEPTPAPTEAPSIELPTPAPTEAPGTPEPTAVPSGIEVINEDFNEIATVWDAHGDYWGLGWGLSIHWDRCSLAVRDGADKWVRFDPIRSNESDVYALPLWMNVAEEKQYTLGSGADVSTDPYVVVEMDLAITGADADKGSLLVRMGGNGYFGVTNFVLRGDSIVRHIDSSLTTGLDPEGKNAYTAGTVGHLKYVLNRATKQYSYFWNGVLVEQDVNAQFGGDTETPALKYICFEANPIVLAEGQSEADVQVFVDNVVMYGTGN